MNPQVNSLYLLEHKSSGLIKIGITCRLSERMLNLRVGVSTEMLAAVACQDSQEQETRLHQKYDQYRLPQSEWFHIPAEQKSSLVSEVKELGESLYENISNMNEPLLDEGVIVEAFRAYLNGVPLPGNFDKWTKLVITDFMKREPKQMQFKHLLDLLQITKAEAYDYAEGAWQSTPMGLVRRLKLEQARYWLSKGMVASVAEARRKLGFSNRLDFNVRFSQAFGVLPTEIEKMTVGAL